MNRNSKTKLYCFILYVTLVAGLAGSLLPLPTSIIVVVSASLLYLALFFFFHGLTWQSFNLIAIVFALGAGASFTHTSQLGTTLGLALIALASLLMTLLFAE